MARHGLHKFTDDQIETMKRGHADGISVARIARSIGQSRRRTYSKLYAMKQKGLLNGNGAAHTNGNGNGTARGSVDETLIALIRSIISLPEKSADSKIAAIKLFI